MNNSINCVGGIKDRSFYVRIGGVLDPKELLFLQEIKISLFINFHIAPNATITDDLRDVYCYQKIIDCIANFCESSQLTLIEHFLCQLKDCIKKTINFKLEDKMNIKIVKVNTSAFFEINEFTR